MSKLKFKHIEAVHAVIRQGSASAAARKLGMSQPAVSKIIAQAEVLLGYSLFDRRQGKLLPNSTAMQFYEQSAQLFTTLDRAHVILDQMVSGRISPIQIGMVPLLTMALLPQLIRHLPGLTGRTVEVISHDSVNLTNQVAAGQIQFAIVSAMHPIDGVASAHFIQSPCYAAIPLSHPLAARMSVGPVDFHDEPFIGLSSAEALQSGLDALFQSNDVTPREVIRCPLMAGALRMVEDGLGLTIVDRFTTCLGRPDHVKFIPFTPEFSIEYRAIWRIGQTSLFDRSIFMGKAQAIAQNLIAASLLA